MDSKKNILVLLDVNGLLCRKIQNNDLEGKNLANKKIIDAIKCNNQYHIIIRHNIRNFLTKLSETYTVGIYSSTNFININIIMNTISKDWKNWITFTADRNYTALDPDYGVDEDIHSHDTVKMLSMIWQHPIFNANRKWNQSNTLLIDHEVKKLRFNNAENILIVEEYTLEDHFNGVDHINELMAQIENKLAELSIHST